MLLWLTEVLSEYFSALTVFQYLTLRGILGTLTALLISLIIGPMMIRKLSQYQIGQAVRDDGPQTHLSKAGTPTMGGALILVAIGISTLLWADLGNRYVWITLLVTLLFGAIGWVDDYRKVVERNRCLETEERGGKVEEEIPTTFFLKDARRFCGHVEAIPGPT